MSVNLLASYVDYRSMCGGERAVYGPEAKSKFYALQPLKAGGERMNFLALFTHVAPDGIIEDDVLQAIEGLQIDWHVKVVCCFPKAAAARYPHLNIVGGWDEETIATFWPKDQNVHIQLDPKSRAPRLGEDK